MIRQITRPVQDTFEKYQDKDTFEKYQDKDTFQILSEKSI